MQAEVKVIMVGKLLGESSSKNIRGMTKSSFQLPEWNILPNVLFHV